MEVPWLDKGRKKKKPKTQKYRFAFSGKKHMSPWLHHTLSLLPTLRIGADLTFYKNRLIFLDTEFLKNY